MIENSLKTAFNERCTKHIISSVSLVFGKGK